MRILIIALLVAGPVHAQTKVDVKVTVPPPPVAVQAPPPPPVQYRVVPCESGACRVYVLPPVLVVERAPVRLAPVIVERPAVYLAPEPLVAVRPARGPVRAAIRAFWRGY